MNVYQVRTTRYVPATFHKVRTGYVRPGTYRVRTGYPVRIRYYSTPVCDEKDVQVLVPLHKQAISGGRGRDGLWMGYGISCDT